MKHYWNYLKYLLEHKKNVFIECWKVGLYVHAFTHDLSKFLPSEFGPYARKFYLNGYSKYGEFEIAWNHHQKRNKHHWNYWVTVDNNGKQVALDMPKKYILQMICDWRGMSRKFGDTWQEFYEKNKDKMVLSKRTISTIEWYMDIL